MSLDRRQAGGEETLLKRSGDTPFILVEARILYRDDRQVGKPDGERQVVLGETLGFQRREALHGFHSHLHDPKALAKNTAVYYGMISLTDKYIGRILDRLEDLGLAEDTLVLFTTDHGHFYVQHGLTAKGAFHYEDMVKVPFIVRPPGQADVGTTSDATQGLVDLAPSFLGACGLEIPRSMTGIDQSSVWMGRSESARDHVIVENRHEPTTIQVKTYID